MTANFQPPPGFVLDPNSGMYYQSVPGNDPATGQAGNWITWFNAGMGEYTQQFYPADAVAPVVQQQQVLQQQLILHHTTPPPCAQHGMGTPSREGNKRFNPVLIVLPLVGLLIGIGVAYFLHGMGDKEGGYVGTTVSGGGENSGGNVELNQDGKRISNRGDDKISLNLEFFEIRSNAEIIRLNGSSDAVSRAEVFEAIVDYSGSSVPYPFIINLFPKDKDEFDRIRRENDVGAYNDTPGNIWSENFYMQSIEVEGYSNIQTLFHAVVPLTFENVSNSFEFYDGDPEFIPAASNSFGVDLWVANYLNDLCYFRIIFAENNGEFLAARLNATFFNSDLWSDGE